MDKAKTQQLLIALQKSSEYADEETSKQIYFCKEVLSYLVFINNIDDNEPHKTCPFNFKRQQHWFQQQYDLVDSTRYRYNDRLFLICAAYLGELVLYWRRHSEYEDKKTQILSTYWDKFKNNQYSIDQDLSELVHYTQHEMPIDILNSYLGQKDYQAFLNYEKTVEEAEDKINKLQTQLHNEEERFNSKISEREEKVDNLKASLENFQTAFNFVGLSQGFENLLKKKSRAKWLTFVGLIALFVLTLLPLSLVAIHLLSDMIPQLMKSFLSIPTEASIPGGANAKPELTNIAEVATWSWQKMLPVIGLEFVLIYFFRVVLTHYHSIQTQIMQLELRQSLCQFIQNYAEYAKEIKASDKDALEKFENLIFSSILSNPDKVPGTFDGIDSLASLLKELKSK